MGFCNCSMFYCALLCVNSSFAINSMGKRELVALLCLSSCRVALPRDAGGSDFRLYDGSDLKTYLLMRCIWA